MSSLLDRPILVLSPHLDDAVLSCGGLLLQHSDAEVITVFSADPPVPRPKALATVALPEERRAEDACAMGKLGCSYHLADLPDAIDRVGPNEDRLYPRLSALFGPVAVADAPVCESIVAVVTPLLADRLLFCPMAVGAHVDHQLCAHAGRRLLAAGFEVLFYEDAPYVYPEPGPAVAGDSIRKAAGRLRARVSGIENIAIDTEAKAEVVACYTSQITALFGDMRGYRRSSQSHYASLGSNIERLHVLRF